MKNVQTLFWQTRPVGQYSLHSGQYWVILKINRRNSLNIGGNMLYNSRKWRENVKVIINYDTFRNVFRPQHPCGQQFWKVCTENFF